MGFSFFFHFSNLELKVFVEDSLNFTDYCVTLLEYRSQYLDVGLEEQGLNFISKNQTTNQMP
jgi:hypothetical protein